MSAHTLLIEAAEIAAIFPAHLSRHFSALAGFIPVGGPAVPFPFHAVTCAVSLRAR